MKAHQHHLQQLVTRTATISILWWLFSVRWSLFVLQRSEVRQLLSFTPTSLQRKTSFTAESCGKTRFSRSLRSESRQTNSLTRELITHLCSSSNHRSDLIRSDRNEVCVFSNKTVCSALLLPATQTQQTAAEEKTREQIRLRCVHGPAKSSDVRGAK